MERVQSTLQWFIIVSASSHIFCCVLPTMISLATLMTGAGLFYGALPFVESFHTAMHAYEAPMLVFSSVALAFGWAAQWYSWRIDCHSTGCVHGPCRPKKRRAQKILLAASCLFAVNFTVFLFIG